MQLHYSNKIIYDTQLKLACSMNYENVYYINVKPYYHDIPFEEMISRFVSSDIGKRVIKDDNFETNIMDFLKLYKYNCTKKDHKEYEVDKIVGKHIIIHLQTFFDDRPKKNRTMKNFKKNKGEKKTTKTHRSI